MDILKIIGIGFCSLIVSVILKEYKKEYAIYSMLIGGAIIICLSLETISKITNFIKQFSKTYNNTFIEILLKITGISILTEYAVSICKDAGESSIANKIDFASKILVISMSIPIISSTLSLLLKLLP